VDDAILNEYRRILLIERQDSAGIGCRALLKHPHVKTLLKMYCYSDLSVHNGPATGGRIFLDSMDRQIQTPEITPEDFAKIQPGFNFMHYDYLNQLFELLKNVQIKPISERKIDLFFAGTVEYGDSIAGKLITEHRKKCVENILECGNQGLNVIAEPGRVYPYNQYIQHLLDSKVILSPFGWGEFCYRDYEAILCGCIVIKPWFEKCLQIPDISAFLHKSKTFDSFNIDEFISWNTMTESFYFEQQYSIVKYFNNEQKIIERILK
jgi:hypothetical protein